VLRTAVKRLGTAKGFFFALGMGFCVSRLEGREAVAKP
jgi:hypothetical protein